MKTDTIIEIVLGSLILTALGWIAVQTYDLKGSVSAMDSTLNNTAQRVDRIADALPDVKVRVAYEEINRQYEGALVTTKPIETLPDEWASFVHYFDSIDESWFTFKVPLEGQDDDTLKYWMAGIAATSDLHSVSFKELEAMSVEIKQPVVVPSYVDQDASFFWSESSTWLDEAMLESLLSSSEKLQHAGIPLETIQWEEMIGELMANPDIFTEQ